MTPDQAGQLAQLIREERAALHVSMRQLAAMADVPYSTLAALEAGATLTPQPNTLLALAEALSISVSDMYSVADWLPANDLPSFRPYMRLKYKNLDDAALADLEAYANQLDKRLGMSGPLDHEDEK